MKKFNVLILLTILAMIFSCETDDSELEAIQSEEEFLIEEIGNSSTKNSLNQENELNNGAIISNCPGTGSICASPNRSLSYFINNSASISWTVANGDISIIGGQGTDSVLIRTGNNFVGGQIIGFDPNGCTTSVVLLICNPSDPFDPSDPFTEGWNNTNHIRTVADVNGDGKADVIGFGNDDIYVSLSNGSSFGSPTVWNGGFTNGWNNINHTRTVADVNGDGKADVIGFGNTNVFVSFSEGNSFGTTNIAFL